MFRVNIPYHTWRLNIWNGLNLDVLPYKPIFHWCRSESQRLSYLKSIEARVCRWLGLYVCASQVCVSMCGGRSVRLLPKADMRPRWNGIRTVLLVFNVDALLTRRYALYYVFSIRAAQCNGRFYNNLTARVSFPSANRVQVSLFFPQCALFLHPSLPSFLPSTATPGTSSAGNSLWQWLMLLSLILGFCRSQLVKAERCIAHYPYHLLYTDEYI